MPARPRTMPRGDAANWMSIPDCATETNMTRRWWYERVWAGELAAVKLGRHIRVRRDEFERFLARHAA